MSVSFSLPSDEAIDFQNEVNCVAGGWAFGRRLKFCIETGREEEVAVCMEVLVVTPHDYLPVDLCCQKKKGQSHESLFFRPYQCDEHNEGVSTGFITFYCKGSHHKGQSVNGCRAKGPSTIRLKFILEFGEDDFVEIFSEPFRLHARRPRKKFRAPVRYPMIKNLHCGPQPLPRGAASEPPEPQDNREKQPLVVIKQEPRQQRKRPLAVVAPPTALSDQIVKKPRPNYAHEYDFAQPSTSPCPNGVQVFNVKDFPQLLSFQQAPPHQLYNRAGVEVPRSVQQEHRVTTRRSRQMASDTVGPTKMIGGPDYFPPNSIALPPLLPNPFDYQIANVEHHCDMLGYYPPKEIQRAVDEDSLMQHIEDLLANPLPLKQEPHFCVVDHHSTHHQLDHRVHYSPFSGDNNVVLGVYFGSTDHIHFHPEPPQAMEIDDDNGYLIFLDD